MKRSIIHVDMDAFFAAVEQRDHPEWRGKPVIVGSAPNKRGVVCTCSYEARKFGLHSAMPSCTAGARCPQGIFVRPDMARYKEASGQVFSIFHRYTPMVEPISIDEAFLDITGVLRLLGSPQEIAVKIRADIKKEVGLNASVGIASNKFMAKIGSEKAKPDGIFEVPDSEPETINFLGRLNVGELWGVGSVSRKKLESAGFFKVSDIQAANPDQLIYLFGERFADHLINLSYGRDFREVEKAAPEKSISKEHTFMEDVSDRNQLSASLKDLCDEVGSRLRAQGYLASVCRIKLRWSDFTTITRQCKFETAVCDDFSIREKALNLFNKETIRASVRLIGVGVSSLTQTSVEQLSLFDNGYLTRKKHESLSRTVDIIRDKLGRDAIMRGSRGG
ncbi:MAG: DNA polymerase IV [Kiritimatiellae bacterium]|jgi:DNA polymerase-4|nr:DNA polymerase IV [Kiritimatiellia bacterium]